MNSITTTNTAPTIDELESIIERGITMYVQTGTVLAASATHAFTSSNPTISWRRAIAQQVRGLETRRLNRPNREQQAKEPLEADSTPDDPTPTVDIR